MAQFSVLQCQRIGPKGLQAITATVVEHRTRGGIQELQAQFTPLILRGKKEHQAE